MISDLNKQEGVRRCISRPGRQEDNARNDDSESGKVLTRMTLFNGTIVASALALVVYCPIWSAWDMSTIPRFRGWMAG
jgi:hypothetical protein